MGDFKITPPDVEDYHKAELERVTKTYSKLVPKHVVFAMLTLYNNTVHCEWVPSDLGPMAKKHQLVGCKRAMEDSRRLIRAAMYDVIREVHGERGLTPEALGTEALSIFRWLAEGYGLGVR